MRRLRVRWALRALYGTAALTVAVLAWLFPQLPRGERDETERGLPEVATLPAESGVDSAEPAEERVPVGRDLVAPAGRDPLTLASRDPIVPAGSARSGPGGITERPPPADPALPVRLSLGDGEQAVILGGRASLAVAFTQIGEEEFPSLRVEGDGAPKTLALLGPGGRVEFIAAGRHYVASVLRQDLAAKRLDLQVDSQQ